MHDRILRKIQTAVSPHVNVAAERDMVRELAVLVDGEIGLERQRCIGICQARAELWTNTTSAKSSIAAARDEARARTNEAMYIADLLASESRYHTDSTP